MEPFLAAAEVLKSRGHEVVCAFPEQFNNLAKDSGIRCHALSKKFIELIGTEQGQMAMGGDQSRLKKIQLYYRLYKESAKVNAVMLDQQAAIVKDEAPDRIIYGGKAIYPIIWGIQNPGKAIALSPVPCLIHPVRELPHVGFNGNYGALLNKATYRLANWGLVKHVTSTTKELRKTVRIVGSQIKPAIFAQKMIYTVSPTLFPQRAYWPQHVKVVGYRERKKTRNWRPDQALTEFLNRNKKVLFVTFGSMTNPEPEEKTAMILEILERNSIPAIINTASGGLMKPANHNAKTIHFIEQIPYDWVFPRVYAVIHHGGSGTTHTALKYGCAAMIIPHIIDQFLWNTLISNKGIGPKGIPINKLCKEQLEQKLMDLYSTKEYRQKAEYIAKEMKKENLDDLFYEVLS
jgi:UDP:flavonoid glycosyltransferase YjiC (YdhE family)